MRSTDSIWKRFMPLFIVFLMLLLSACSNDYAQQIQKHYSQVELNLDALERKLYYKELTNAKIVDIYAKKLALINPDFKPVAEALANDASEKGTLYQGLLQRLAKVNREPENKQQFQQAIQSLTSIDMGADPVVFNDALIDLINTLAELSEGQLKSVSVPRESQAAHVRGETITAGSYLVGNPNYGDYRRDNSGRSFWHWYGQYSFFNSMFRGRSSYNQQPVYYDRWNARPHYSYYNDYGRTTYGSRNDRTQTTQRNTSMRDKGLSPAKPKKQYGSALGRKRISTYNQQRLKQTNSLSKKLGSSKEGGRHADKTVAKRSSSFFNNKKTVSRPSSTVSKRSSRFFNSKKTVSRPSSTVSKRSSSFFNSKKTTTRPKSTSSKRSSYGSSSRSSRSSGGK